jgi:hypothetical protein
MGFGSSISTSAIIVEGIPLAERETVESGAIPSSTLRSSADTSKNATAADNSECRQFLVSAS